MRALLIPLLALALAGPALADGDHERALDAVERGQALPLAEILAIVDDRYGGRVIEVAFERDDGRYVYELELVDRAGRLFEVYLDASTGAVIEQEREDAYDDDDDHGDHDDDEDRD
ncbi:MULTISPECIES: PepSY domain-containing protein [unclassified Roseitalea]|uniref:PepSY domain-containing protein n=1 Tax=unclassified Roseitalea TaxID=2639107 RepID=UPI00273F71C1|nr:MULTISPECIES: PepSY domain-containing protein [unclassified Roseitalea]